jgi:hypothetical protein
MHCTWLARVGLVISSLLIVFLVAEVVVRLTWKKPWYERLEEEHAVAEAEPESYPVGRFMLPLRRAQVTTPKPDGVARVLFLGDSFTYGMGVPEEEVFVSLVTEDLVAKHDTRVELYNGGIPGSLTKDWRAFFDAMGAKYDPDLVVSVFFLRDGVLGVTSNELIHAIRRRLQERLDSSVAYRLSLLYRLVELRLARQELSRSYLWQLDDGYVGPPRRTLEWQRAQRNLLWIRDRSEQLGSRFVLVIFPVLFGLEQEEYPVQGAVDAISGFANDNGIPVLSLLPTYRGHHGPDLWVSALDQHPNALAHRLAAEAISPFVVKHLTR